MAKATKKFDFTKELHDNPKYKRAMELARTDEERKKIAVITNAFVDSFAGILAPIIEQAKEDPEFARKLGQALKDKQHVVTSEPPKSGSIR